MAATPISTVTGAFAGMGEDLLTIAAVGLGIGVTVLAVKKGYKVARGFF